MIPEALRSLQAPDRFGKFVLVGAAGAASDMTVLALLVELLHLVPEVAKVASAEVAILLMFAINERWTFHGFGEEDRRSTLRRLLRSNLVRWVGAGIALLTLLVLHRFLGVWYLLANAVGIGFGLVANYIFESLVTWRVHVGEG